MGLPLRVVGYIILQRLVDFSPVDANVFTSEAVDDQLLNASHEFRVLVGTSEAMRHGLRRPGELAGMPVHSSYKYDDEGVRAIKNYLIQEGKLVGRLHSRETAARMNETPTGNARAISYRHPPIVRMTNTYIEPGSASFDDMIADIKEGVYVKNWYGGQTSMEMFTFSAGEAYMIRDGEIAETLRPVVLTGNVFSTLENIDAIGNDLDMNQGGGCGKGAQSPLPVSNGSPHIRIRHCLVGGN